MRSRHDREILLLGLPALGALAAEPLYVLVDTAIVGHLGTTQLASLAIAATVMSTAFTIFNFLTYGTTAQVARLHGAGRDDAAAALGSQALWLGVGIGLLLLVLIELLAPAVVSLMGGEGEVADGAVLYLRISALGGPLFILASAAQGYLRGVGDLRTPLLILVAAHIVNVGLEFLFVYGFDWGLKGSAWGTVIAQAGMAAAFFAVQYRAGLERPHPDKMRPLMRIGSEIAVRTVALTGSFLVGSAVLARIGAASLGAHQIAFQLWVFLALVLDAIAIAGQVMVGRMLGASEAVEARGGGGPHDRLVGGDRRGVRRGPARARRPRPRAVHQRPGGGRQGARDLAAVRADDAVQRGGVRARRDSHRRRRHALFDVGDDRRRGRLRPDRPARATTTTGASSACGGGCSR